MVKVEFSNKTLFIILGFVAAFAILGFAYAYGGTSPSTMGHSLGELQTCGGYETIFTNSTGAWDCSKNIGYNSSDCRNILIASGRVTSGYMLVPSSGGSGNSVITGNINLCGNNQYNYAAGVGWGYNNTAWEMYAKCCRVIIMP